MKLIVPEGYTDFKCIASKCRHTCCAGWEIDIDEDSLKRYCTMEGALGEELREYLEEDDTGTHFRLGEHERCPMLTQGNLCRLILEKGEDSLCQICADHPRFRNFFRDRTELGLGLCCEEAARQQLTRTEPFRLMVLEDDGQEEELDHEEDWLLAFRAQLMRVLQLREQPLMQRLYTMQHIAGMLLPKRTLQQWAEFLLTLEQLDEAWGERLRTLAQTKEIMEPDPSFDIAFEQLGAYLLYRQIPGALEDGMAEERVLLCVLLVQLARALFAQRPQTMEELVETARLLSSELEYSDENIAAILEQL